MSKILEIFKAFDYSITSGFDPLWNCWKNSKGICFSNNYGCGRMIASFENDLIYEIQVIEHNLKNPYKWINYDYRDSYDRECASRNVDPLVAWDSIKWATTDSYEDILDKVTNIMRNQEYDKDVVMELDLDDDLILVCAKRAHKRGITLNQFFVETIEAFIEESNRKPEEIQTSNSGINEKDK